LFRVAKGQARPFVVQALDRLVTAHGTVFDVRIEPGRKVKVALVEGSVSVANASAPLQTATELQPNEILVASNDQVQVSRAPDIDKEVSWRDGLIVFEDESLADATAEVNRYVRTSIVLQDDRLRQIRVSGAFRTGETAAFVEALQLSFPVRVVERNNQRIVLAYRG
jgi:transmembrane sensor